MKLKTILPLAALASLTLPVHAALVASTGTPIAAWSFNINSPGNNTFTGDLTHTDGLQMSGFTDTWGNLGNPNTGSQISGTSNGYTLTWNVGGASSSVAWWGSTAPRRDHADVRLNNGLLPWRVEGLTPGAAYDFIVLASDNNPNHPLVVSIPGFDAGNGVGAAVTLDAEGDGNFSGVIADGSGYINGTATSTALNQIGRISGFQLAELPAAIPEPTTTALLGLGGLALAFRRRK